MSILIFEGNYQNDEFYALMGKYFASRKIAKELEQQVYNEDGSVWYVATQDGYLTGFVSVFEKGKHYFIDNLYVLPQYRGQGIAKKLVGSICKEDYDKPLKCIASNEYALKIFLSFGFVEVGTNGKYKKLCKH